MSLSRPSLKLLSLPGRSFIYHSTLHSVVCALEVVASIHVCIPKYTLKQWQGFCSLRTLMATLWAFIMPLGTQQQLLPGKSASDVLLSLNPGRFWVLPHSLGYSHRHMALSIEPCDGTSPRGRHQCCFLSSQWKARLRGHSPSPSS